MFPCYSVVAVIGVDVSKEVKDVNENKDPETVSEDENENTPLLT